MVNKSQGVLSIVGTPIGNLSDASPRVVDTLASSDVILCEDTRVSSKLLAHFGVHVTLERADEHTISSRIPSVLARLDSGEHISFVSDAGMPSVSDPGQKLVDAALDQGYNVEVIPGPSAAICAVVASGFAMEHFYFEGFLPRRSSEQKRRLQEIASIPGALVIYESPRRVAQTLANIAYVMASRQVALIRELTKLHEEVVRGTAPELADEIAQRSEVRGECVIVVAAPTESELKDMHESALPTIEQAIAQGLGEGESTSALAKRLAKTYGLSKSEVYDKIVRADTARD